MVPRSILVHGTDLTSAVEVRVNGDTSPSFVVADRGTIVAQVPSSSAGRLVTDVVVVSSDFTASLRSIIDFKISNYPKKVSGVKALMQMWLKLLLTTPGYDSFTQGLGGAAQQYIGGQYSGGGGAVSASFAVAVQQATKQVLALQSTRVGIPDDERLIGTELVGISFDPEYSGLLARVAIYTQAGNRAIANMEL
ncbi:hypothetical protein UFOVP276_113 [uncultured Caudovirales phage]|uniref:Uncharacterized protein n=1 Tax=uncultured Caudovirales phage TaxID=2100421 RepID=A0A6J5LBX5_9CAUD|nr:hypothetical protein UFOVP127_7 [uncultured Caudovirales phage]CAB4135157.1 hypothetical protein UFOVP276_113 [uncultured Caudovirales phage]